MKDEVKGVKGSTLNRVKRLKKQYNKILVDLFDQYAAESIEAALEEYDSSFGENVSSVVSNALQHLKTKVLDELGVKCCDEGGAGLGVVGVMMDEPAGAEGVVKLEVDESESESDESESEGDESESEGDESESEPEDDVKEESAKHKSGDLLLEQAIVQKDVDTIVSKARRNDQSSLESIYSGMLKRKK